MLRRGRSSSRRRVCRAREAEAVDEPLKVPEGDLYAWESDSTYVKNPPYFDGMAAQPGAVDPVHGARVLALLGDSITTDHISPAVSIKADGPAGKYLQEHGVKKEDFNSYGSRRGNHEVMCAARSPRWYALHGPHPSASRGSGASSVA